MEHVVFYESRDGTPAFRRAGSLDEAVRFAEQLRNVEDCAQFSVHALTDVPLAVRTYYRVEVPGLPGTGAPQQGSGTGAPPQGSVAGEPTTDDAEADTTPGQPGDVGFFTR